MIARQQMRRRNSDRYSGTLATSSDRGPEAQGRLGLLPPSSCCSTQKPCGISCGSGPGDSAAPGRKCAAETVTVTVAPDQQSLYQGITPRGSAAGCRALWGFKVTSAFNGHPSVTVTLVATNVTPPV